MRWLEIATSPDAIAELRALARAGNGNGARAPPDAPLTRALSPALEKAEQK